MMRGCTAVLPALTDVGQEDLLLPSGVHQGTLDEVKTLLVDGFPSSLQRIRLWESYVAFRTLIRALVPVDHEYLDGSFVTSRPAPKDVDLSIWVDAAAIDRLGPQDQVAFARLWR